MAKKNIADKYWIYGEDAELAARLTSYRQEWYTISEQIISAH